MRVLITGGAGILAGYLIETAPDQVELAATWHQRPFRCDGCRHEQLDVTDREATLATVARCRPEVVVHTAGIGNVDRCQRDPGLGRRSNVDGTANVITACRRAGARLVHISTNAVYGGEEPPYGETGPQRPVNTYGLLKLECDRLVRDSGLDWAIVRPILMYGWSRSWSRKDFVVWIVENLRQGTPINLVTDVRENPLAAEDCARAVWRIIEREARGEFNIAGRDTVDRHALGLLAADVFGCDRTLARPVGSDAFPAIAPRPRDTSFDTAKMVSALDLCPRGLRDGLVRMRDTEPAPAAPLVRRRLCH